jgi:hypothetical protein
VDDTTIAAIFSTRSALGGRSARDNTAGQPGVRPELANMNLTLDKDQSGETGSW